MDNINNSQNSLPYSKMRMAVGIGETFSLPSIDEAINKDICEDFKFGEYVKAMITEHPDKHLSTTSLTDDAPAYFYGNNLVAVINGCGRSGKDTFVKKVATEISAIRVHNISSIDPVRDVATKLYAASGVEINSKNDTRKLLSRMKEVWDDELDGSTKYLIKRVREILIPSHKNKNVINVIFVHIREPRNIVRFMTEVNKLAKYNVHTASILVEGRTSPEDFDNDSDRLVKGYEYDIYVDNSGDINALSEAASAFADYVVKYFRDRDVEFFV